MKSAVEDNDGHTKYIRIQKEKGIFMLEHCLCLSSYQLTHSCSLDSKKMRCASYTPASRFRFQVRICISSSFQRYGHSAVMVQSTVLYHKDDL